MKKIYTLILCALSIFSISAQVTSTAALNSCKNEVDGTIEIKWNSLLNCPTGDVSGITEFGFHSAAEDWGVFQVDWDAAGSTTATLNSGDTAEVTVNPFDYYGIALADMTALKFVFNDGVATPADPWLKEGKDTVPGGFGCNDLILIIDSLPECSIVDTSGGTGFGQLEAVSFLDVFPNPAGETVTLSFPNYSSESFEVIISNAIGQLVSTALTQDNNATINRNGLPSGLYFATLRTEEGYRSTVQFQFQ